MPATDYVGRVQEWIATLGSAKGRLARRALEIFGARGYADVGVGELAAAAGVTTGALYHHFGSKAGLYQLVRTEAERRITDRMEGALEAAGGGPDAVRAALLVGYDAAVRMGLATLLSEVDPAGGPDPVAGSIEQWLRASEPGQPREAHHVVAAMVTAAWRAALAAGANAASAAAGARARAALSRLSLTPP